MRAAVTKACHPLVSLKERLRAKAKVRAKAKLMVKVKVKLTATDTDMVQENLRNGTFPRAAPAGTV